MFGASSQLASVMEFGFKENSKWMPIPYAFIFNGRHVKTSATFVPNKIKVSNKFVRKNKFHNVASHIQILNLGASVSTFLYRSGKMGKIGHARLRLS